MGDALFELHHLFFCKRRALVEMEKNVGSLQERLAHKGRCVQVLRPAPVSGGLPRFDRERGLPMR